MKRSIAVAVSLLFFSSVVDVAEASSPLSGHPSGSALVAPSANDIAGDNQSVVVNTGTLKYQCASCTWAKRHTSTLDRLARRLRRLTRIRLSDISAFFSNQKEASCES